MADAQLMTFVALTGAGGPDKLHVETAPVPTPGPGQVLIRTEAAGVAFNDITTRQGRNPGKLPAVIGSDAIGRVEAVGADVGSLKAGDRVAALLGAGGYSTHIIIEARRAVLVPEGLDAAEVDALILNYLTAWQMLHRTAEVQPGQSVLVLGAAGGVGSALRELSALEDVTVFGSSTAGRRGAVESSGARWVASAADLPVKVDVVFDPIGGPSLARSRAATRQGGAVVSYGFSFTVTAGHSKYGGLARTAAALFRAKLTPGPKLLVHVEDPVKKNTAYREDLTHLLQLLAAGQLHPQVTTLPLSQAAHAHRLLEDRKVVGKLVLIPD